jgi:prepilin-type N-terminal cleavage/methylation domain-containing protein
MVAARASLRGFTLIELMIVLAITGLLIGLSTGAFSLFSQNFTKRESGFRESAERLRRLDLVYAAIESAVPWVVKADDGGYGYYFLGRDEGLTLVTVSGIYSAGAPAVIRLFREPDGPGRWQLVYEEAALAETVLARADQELPFSHRLIVLKDLSGLEFEYFGWPTKAAMLAAEEDSLSAPVWTNEYDGLKTGVHPSLIKIRFDSAEWFFSVPTRQGFSRGE